MLFAADYGGVENLSVVTGWQDISIRRAFGRHSDPTARRLGSVALAELATARGGHYWLVCDCRRDASTGLAPVLIPVELSHIRRHENHAWPRHRTSCDFYAYREEQIEIDASFRFQDTSFLPTPKLARHPVGSRVSLAPFRISGISQQERRPQLGQVLARLLTLAGIQSMAVSAPPAPIREQFAALRSAALRIAIAPGYPLEPWLRTAPARYNDLIEKINEAKEDSLGGQQPHGYAIGIADGLDRQIVLAGDRSINIVGSITVVDDKKDEPFRDAGPYLFIALAARPTERTNPPCFVKAYLQPLLSDKKQSLAVADSPSQRICFKQIYSALRWVYDQFQLDHHIEKPLYLSRPRVDAPAVRPDFLVIRGHRQWAITIEAQGISRPESERQALADAYPGRLLSFQSDVSENPTVTHSRFRKALIAAVLNESAMSQKKGIERPA